MSEKSSKAHWINRIIVIFVSVTLLYAGYIGWQHYQIDQELVRVKTSIKNQENRLEALKSNDTIGEKYKAQQILDRAQKYRVNWSVIAADINKLADETQGIKFLSLSADENQLVSIEGRAEELITISRLIARLKNNHNFTGSFVPNITQENSQDGALYKFQVSFQYNQ